MARIAPADSLAGMAEQVPLDDPRLTPGFGEEINGPGRAYYADPTIDNLMDALLAMAAELWETRDRLRHLEAVLTEEGVAVSARIEARAAAYADPDRRAACDAYVLRLFGAFLRRTSAPVPPEPRA